MMGAYTDRCYPRRAARYSSRLVCLYVCLFVISEPGCHRAAFTASRQQAITVEPR